VSFFQAAQDVRTTQRPGAPGDWAGHGDHDHWGSGFNASPQAKQITTTTVSDPGDNTNITLTINGIDITVNTGTGLDATGIAALFVDAIDDDPRVRGDVVPTSASDVLTLTSTLPGADYSFTATESSASLTTPSTSTSAADAEAIPPGRCVINQGFVSGSGEKKVALAKSSLFTAQVQTISVTYVASNLLICNVYEIRNGEREKIGTGTTVAATDRDTTLDALITAINADLPADSVVVTADNATATALVFTAEVAGLEFEAEIIRSGGGASAPTITRTDTTGPSRSTSFHRAFAGISLYPRSDEVATVGSETPTWPANAGLRYAKRGKVWVESDEAITGGDKVYVELGVTADNGQLYNSDSATRIRVARSLIDWDRDGATSTDSIAAVVVNAA
jgi:hypothetical protein